MDQSLLDGILGAISAATIVYGQAVLDSAEVAAGNATLSTARRLIAKLRGRTGNAAIEAAILGIVNHPDDARYEAILRHHIREAMKADRQLQTKLRRLLPEDRARVHAVGQCAIAVDQNHGIISTGGSAVNLIGRS